MAAFATAFDTFFSRTRHPLPSMDIGARPLSVNGTFARPGAPCVRSRRSVKPDRFGQPRETAEADALLPVTATPASRPGRFDQAYGARI